MGRRAVGARPEAQGRILNRSGLERGRGDRKEKVFSAEFTCKTETAYRAKAAGPSPVRRVAAPILSRKSAQMYGQKRSHARELGRAGKGCPAGGGGAVGGRRVWGGAGYLPRACRYNEKEYLRISDDDNATDAGGGGWRGRSRCPVDPCSLQRAPPDAALPLECVARARGRRARGYRQGGASR